MKKILFIAFAIISGFTQAQVKKKTQTTQKPKVEKKWVNPVKLTKEERSRPYMDEVLKTKDSLTPAEAERRRKNIAIGNPFAKYGVYPKIATLSKGKYLEFHDTDSIVVIGSVRYNTKKGSIIEVREVDLSDPDAQPIGDTHGRWISPDPLSEEHPDWTPYRYGFNNPLRYADPTGLLEDDYVFDEQGKFVRVDENDKPDQLVIENSKTKNQTVYQFNDPKTDVAAIKYNMKKFGDDFKNHQFVFSITNDWMSIFGGEAGIYKRSWLDRNIFAITESLWGNMDPSFSLLGPFLNQQGEGETWDPEKEVLKDKGPMFIFQGDGYQVYNHLDAGNFIWGHFMNHIGFDLTDTVKGAKTFNSNDTKADLRAIKNGFMLNKYKPIFKNTPIKNGGD
ncbi:RHS repeat domain-containing protein [Chryseobacterium oryctis]|uniref:RHS repeat-associated core domain-containing protein n=1 Tax=Chryseobacterium oryctis TaxID=2952618 RepID=A0ABT3HIS0_9FLAO|nr:hypothetical protein [Chryseobacterium oryctis]MCW3159684.1 hypothetical protein [Chryseobacterium oryctis]